MQLYYFQNPEYDNVGDDLNKWMWDELIPGAFDDRGDTLFVGIGTLLNNQLPKAAKTVVFGSGVGYGTGLPAMDDSWRFYCVRGPLSAQKLGLSADRAVTDGAALLHRLRRLPENPKQYPFSYMPHALFSQRAGDSWERLCADIGFGYIDARWPIERVLDALSRTDVLITEAMHGAIIADTMRVPWVPVQSHSIIFPFKWLDWTQTVAVDYQPHQITGLWEHQGLTPQHIKYWLTGGPHWLRYQQVRRQLQQISKVAKPVLSEAIILESLVCRLEERLDQFRADYPHGSIPEHRSQSRPSVPV